jgi:hypothetical protein
MIIVPYEHRVRSHVFQIFGILGLLVFFFQVTACAPTITIGKMPKIDALVNFTPGVSNIEDIRNGLGEPHARGMSRWSIDKEMPAKIWEYQFTKASGGKIQFTLLMVFIREGHYDGHLWFSSAEEIKSKIVKGTIGK